MSKSLEEDIRRRANGLCEYCHAPQALYRERFQLDHVIARQHGGNTSRENLALSCLECNLRKGPNLSSIDPMTQQVVRLFDPRANSWNENFCWRGAILLGLTPVGRATCFLLDVNRTPRVLVRQTWIDEAVFPPPEDRLAQS